MNGEPAKADDEQHLRLLSMFHYIIGAVDALIACFPLIHLTFGLLLLYAPQKFAGNSADQPPAVVGWLFILLGAAFFLCGIAFAICVMIAGRSIKQRQRYWFVFVIACIQCAFFPFGTALGVFTIVVLCRPSVKRLFGIPAATTAP